MIAVRDEWSRQFSGQSVESIADHRQIAIVWKCLRSSQPLSHVVASPIDVTELAIALAEIQMQ